MEVLQGELAVWANVHARPWLRFVLLGQHRRVEWDTGFMLLLCDGDETDAD